MTKYILLITLSSIFLFGCSQKTECSSWQTERCNKRGSSFIWYAVFMDKCTQKWNYSKEHCNKMEEGFCEIRYCKNISTFLGTERYSRDNKWKETRYKGASPYGPEGPKNPKESIEEGI